MKVMKMQVLSLSGLINNPLGAEDSHLVQHLPKHQIPMLAPFNKNTLSAKGLSPLGTRVGFAFATASNSLFLPLLATNRLLIIVTLLLHILVFLRVFLFGHTQKIRTPTPSPHGWCSSLELSLC